MKSQRFIIAHEEIVDIFVENDVLTNIHTTLASEHYTSVGILCDETTQALFLPRLEQSIRKLGIAIHPIVIPAGEKSKSIAVMTTILHDMLKAQLDRKSVLIALGGGVVGDLATLVAGLYYRGIACVQIPTTLLSQVDASIGGKGAIDIHQHKNTIGIIKQPRFIFVDPSTLRSLPQEQIRSGMGEVIKYALAQDKELFQLLETSSHLYDDFAWIIQRCIQLKMAIVKKDPLDITGQRHILNFGHTFGQAIELQTTLLHGEAIAIGMCFALFLSKERTGLTTADETRAYALLQKYALPTTITIDKKKVLQALKQDKKSIQGETQFVLLKTIGSAQTQQPIPDTVLKNALATLFL